MDGAIQRFDCEPCHTAWYRRDGNSTACPSCGAEMATVDQPFVAIEVRATAAAVLAGVQGEATPPLTAPT